MIYVKIKALTDDRALCDCDVGHPVDIRRSLLPRTARVGDSFVIRLNDASDGLCVGRVSGVEYRTHARKIERIREKRRKIPKEDNEK